MTGRTENQEMASASMESGWLKESIATLRAPSFHHDHALEAYLHRQEGNRYWLPVSGGALALGILLLLLNAGPEQPAPMLVERADRVPRLSLPVPGRVSLPSTTMKKIPPRPASSKLLSLSRFRTTNPTKEV